MRLLTFLLFVGFAATGCASSDKNDNSNKSFKNLVTLQPPDIQEVKEANIYVDSVAVIEQDGTKALLISGNFPDGCTHLGQASHSSKGEAIQLSLSAWKDPKMMCTQALIPFSFIYDKLAKKDFKALSSVTVNGTIYELK